LRTSLFLTALSILLLGGAPADQPATFGGLLLACFVLAAFALGFVLAVVGDVRELKERR